MDNLSGNPNLENFQELNDEFARIYKRDQSTLRTYRARFNKYHEFLTTKRGIPIVLAERDDIAAYADHLDGEVAPQVKPQYLSALKVLYAFLIKKGIYKGENPFEVYQKSLDSFDLVNAKHDNTLNRIPQKDKFTDEEVELMLDKAPKLMQVPYLTMVIDAGVNSGIRVKSISKLTLDKLRKDDTTGVFYIQLTKGLIAEENDTKTRSQRVPIPETFVERIKAFVERRNQTFVKEGVTIPSDWQGRVFLSNRGHPLDGESISHKFTQFIRKVLPQDMIRARKLSIHSLRKSFASRKLKEGFTLHEVSKMLGHTKITTTILYLQLNEQEVLDAYAEKQKEKSLDFLAEIEAAKETRKTQVSESEIIAQEKVIDTEMMEVLAMLLDKRNDRERLMIHLRQLIEERSVLRAQLISPREQKLLEEREMLLRRIKQLEEETRFASERLKQLPNYKLFEKKTKKTLKTQMQERAAALREQGLGYGKIADAINEEFHTPFTRQTIKYWLQSH
ncbi:MAG: putative site-specific recombinase XerD [Promethearchaeota archaeon CR_4]|nr:MAG: putative site-specific recombinase XerD [Candidatus Lokiarchaeota archaeon CR_4]